MTPLHTHNRRDRIQEPMSYPPTRIAVVGENVATVQKISRFCLGQGLEVLPYYGAPDPEDLTLFDPTVCIVCWPLAHLDLDSLQSYWVWAEQYTEGIPLDTPHIFSLEELGQLLKGICPLY
jgi:hypothetical protein